MTAEPKVAAGASGSSLTAVGIVFMGTPELAAVSLRALLPVPAFRLLAVVTQPDQPRGRGLKLQASPVKEIALRENIPVLQPPRAGDESFVQQLRKIGPDLICVAAFGQILPPAILNLPRFGCLNVHTSLLPKYRGAAPIQRAILNGDTQTGVTIMKMDAGLDTGPILAQEKIPIYPGDNAETLHERLGCLGAELLVATIPEVVAGRIAPRPQPAEGVSHASKIRKQDGHIDWRAPAAAIWNQVRALTPWPGAWTHLPGVPPHLVKIWEASPVPDREVCQPVPEAAGEISHADKTGIVVRCGSGALRISILQREGGRRMSAAEFLAGHPLHAGQKLGP